MSTDARIIKLNNVRLSFPALFTAKAMPNPDGSLGKAKFGAVFLLSKKANLSDITKVKAAIEYVIKEDGKGKRPPLGKTCLRDGSEKPDTDGYGEEVMFISASTDKRPGVVDRNLSPLVEQDGKPYAGCYVNATVRLWYQDNKFGKRVNASLRNVQFVKDGEPFGEKITAADEEFEAMPDDAGSADDAI
jgi:hypothetical protein